MNIIGIDSGTSVLKLVETDEKGNILHKLMLNKISILQAIEIFIKKEKISKEKISKIVLTGIGKDEIEGNIDNIPTIKVDEFTAIGTGGLYLAKKKKALVVSIGTGTAFVNAKGKCFKHIGGTGIGGGTLLNLCKKISNIKVFTQINDIILKGNLENTDLKIKDVSNTKIKTLSEDATLANFGKLNEKATIEDMTLGITNMIFETIGMMAVFATQNTNNKNIIVIGSVATMPYIHTVLVKIEKLHNVKFIIPKQAEFATVIGAIKSIK